MLNENFSPSSVINLTESQVHWDKSEIIVHRKKTGELHVAPLTPLAAAAIREQLSANKATKVRNTQRRVFSWDFDPAWPVTGSQVTHHHRKTCESAGIKGFWARDFRHVCGTRWARMPEVSDAILKLSMGWSQSSLQGKTYFNIGAGAVGSVFVGKK